MKKIKLKFRGKMLLWIIVAVIIISGSLQFYISKNIATVVLNTEKRTLEAKVQSIKKQIDSQLNMDILLAKVLAKNKSFVDAALNKNLNSAEIVRASLSDIVKSDKKFEIIAISNKDGITMASNDKTAIGVSVKDRGYYKKSIRGETYITKPLKSKSTGNLLFGISQPIKDGDKIVGVLFIGNRMSDINDKHVKNMEAGKTGYAFILDSTGMIIAHPKSELIYNETFISNPANAKVVKQFLEAGNSVVRYKWEGMPFYKVGKVAVTQNGWRVCLSVPEPELIEVVDKIDVLFIATTVLLILCMSVVIFILIGSVDKVLKITDKLMLDLSSGKIHNTGSQKKLLEKYKKRQDEFGDMTRATVKLQNYLEAMSEVALNIANKNMDINIETQGSEDVLGNAMKKMVINFNEALAQVNVSAKEVSQGACQLSSASQELSAGAAEQASAIEEITDAVNNLDIQTNENADNAATANKYAIDANKAALKGQQQMQDLSKAMEVMSGRATEVQKIIKTIDDIAFQTNLLALNAAVEAARAGMHGKGFAVVAEEVRNLAARSATAAGETASLIETVVSEIDNGNSMSKTTAESFIGIVEGINNTSSLVSNIASSLNDESNDMKKMSSSLTQIENIIQSNSSSSEETAGASEEMSSMSIELEKLISTFKLSSMPEYENSNKFENQRKRPNNFTARPLSNYAETVNPDEIINLDDDTFGKF